MIHILRGRRTWLDTSPALREAGEFPRSRFPRPLFLLSGPRGCPNTGGGKRLLVRWKDSRRPHLHPIPLVKIRTALPEAARGCLRTDAGSTRSRRDKENRRRRGARPPVNIRSVPTFVASGKQRCQMMWTFFQKGVGPCVLEGSPPSGKPLKGTGSRLP